MIGIDGTKARELEELTLEPGTLLVIEVKTTLGKSKTPGFLKRGRGPGNTGRIMHLISEGKKGCKIETSVANSSELIRRPELLDQALDSEKISFIHAQVFFNTQGKPNIVTGNGTGIQINKWSQ